MSYATLIRQIEAGEGLGFVDARALGAALLALLLKSFGIPVLVHGVLEGGGGTAAAYVLRELGVMPCGTTAQVNAKLLEEGIAFAPVALLSPGLAALLALRARLGIDGR